MGYMIIVMVIVIGARAGDVTYELNDCIVIIIMHVERVKIVYLKGQLFEILGFI